MESSQNWPKQKFSVPVMGFEVQSCPSKGTGSSYQISEHMFYLFINGI